MKNYYCASCSFGKDSLAMVLKLLELKYLLNEIIFFDFGMEFDCIYNNKEKFKIFLEEYNKNNNTNIIFTELKSPIDFYTGFSEIEVKHHNKEFTTKGYSWCGISLRWGTNLKIRTIKKHLEEKLKNNKGILFQYIGIAADELKRIIKNRQNETKGEENFVKLYPLVELGMKEKDCLKYCRENKWDWKEKNGIDIYDVRDRCSCKFCRFLGKKDLYNYYKYLPHIWEEFKELQLKTYLPFYTYKNQSIQDLEKQFKEKDKLFIENEKK